MLRTSYHSLWTLAMVESYEPRRLQSFFQVLGYYLAYYNSNSLSVKETLNIFQDFQHLGMSLLLYLFKRVVTLKDIEFLIRHYIAYALGEFDSSDVITVMLLLGFHKNIAFS